jgi:hypothetical protein
MQRDVQVRERMFSMIRRWQQSGLSQKAYCKQHKVAYHVFHYWYKCFRDLPLRAKEEGFIPLKIQASTSTSTSENTYIPHIELLFADGRRLLFNQAVSSDFLKALIN